MKRSLLGITLAIPVIALAACSSSTGSSGSSSTSGHAAITVPAQYKTLDEAITAWYPPYAEQASNGSPTGLDPKLGQAIAHLLGVKLTLSPESFENELLGLNGQKYNLVPSLTVTAAREQTYDMVTYDIDGYTLATLPGHQMLTASYTSVCGHSVSDEVGELPVTILAGWSKECVAAGKKPITVDTFPSSSAAELALQSGRVQYTTGAISELGYLKKQNPKWIITGPEFGVAPVAIATLKSSKLAPYLVKAIDELIRNGTYAKIMRESGMASENYIKASAMNPAP